MLAHHDHVDVVFFSIINDCFADFKFIFHRLDDRGVRQPGEFFRRLFQMVFGDGNDFVFFRLVHHGNGHFIRQNAGDFIANAGFHNVEQMDDAVVGAGQFADLVDDGVRGVGEINSYQNILHIFLYNIPYFSMPQKKRVLPRLSRVFRFIPFQASPTARRTLSSTTEAVSRALRAPSSSVRRT